MGLLDFIKNLFGNNKTNTQIIAKKFIKTLGDPEPLEVGLYAGKTPISNEYVLIKINGVTYKRKTDENGIAKLNINLNVGAYNTYIDFEENDTYNASNAYCEVIVKDNTILTGNDFGKTASETGTYTVILTDSRNNRLSDKPVDITVNGVTYTRNTDNNGESKLNVRLGVGNYTVNSNYQGNNLYNASHTANKITVVEDPKPEPKPEPEPTPVKLYPYITEQGGGKLGQRTGYTCGPHSLMQAIYRLTGIELSEMELAGICGTTTSGTGHDGLATGLAWFNRKYGYNLKMTWKNFSEVGFDGLQRYYEQGAVFLHLLYRNQWGHYETPLNSVSDPNKILNSLGDQCGNGYCGYIESRSKSTQRSYINGISQKSVCIITR